jgi:hypothetical protein
VRQYVSGPDRRAASTARSFAGYKWARWWRGIDEPIPGIRRRYLIMLLFLLKKARTAPRASACEWQAWLCHHLDFASV